jgi:uncharacterized membrane protein YhaH (DUF805 family)
MLEWMLMPYRRYVDFSGRSRRKEYWMFFLFVMIVYIVCYALILTGLPSIDPVTGQMSGGGGALSMIGSAVLGIFWLATIIPALALAIRRMHDQDKSGWFILIPIYNFILLFIEGTRGPNRFGPDPKDPAGAEAFS